METNVYSKSEGLEENCISNPDGSQECKSVISKSDEGDDRESPTAATWASEARKLVEKGELTKALHYLNLCLDGSFRQKILHENRSLGKEINSGLKGAGSDFLSQDDLGISSLDEINLLEKRCLVGMKLKDYDRVLQDAQRILDKKKEHSIAYKCLLAALCKLNKLDQVAEILKLWKKNTPQDLEMLECRTKLEGLMFAVKTGIDASQAFSNVEDLVGLSYDWLMGRKTHDPQWKYRPLPPGQKTFVLCLQYRFGHCSLGEKCPDAHGEKELEEWKDRYAITNIKMLLDTIQLDSGSAYLKGVLDRIQEIGDDKTVLSDDITEGIKIKCVKPLHVEIAQSKKMTSFIWKFAIESKRPMTHVCLLYERHRQYFKIGSTFFHGPSSKKISLKSDDANSKAAQEQVIELSISPTAIALNGNVYTYSVEVVFTPEVFGIFRQTLLLDFGIEPKSVRNLCVEVVPPRDDAQEEECEQQFNGRSVSPTTELSCNYRARVTWNYGNALILDSISGERVSTEKLGFALINGLSKPDFKTWDTRDPLSKYNYKERMRFFLTQEERARQEILAKYNVTAHLQMMDKYEMSGGYNEGLTKYAVDGSLYGRMTLFRDVSEDTAVGRLILRSCNCVLLTKTEEARKAETANKPTVYLCQITDKTKNAMYIELGSKCTKELMLKESEIASFDIQFQLDRTAFMEQKKVIDQLRDSHLDMLFMNFELPCNIPWNPIKQWSGDAETHKRLNPKQKEALIAITAEGCKTPPILVIGPFGTGKTFTLAQCIRKLLTQSNSRVMVCTHSNSAADLYIKEYLDPWCKEGFEAARPLRIYYSLRNLNSVHPSVLKYCTVENLMFRPPKREEVLAHRVIVVTLSTSYLLMDLKLPEDTFSHILLDEAAQAMETEAITPLMSAGDKTKLVLAGDHMQLSPELFSEESKNMHSSLLERLHCMYPDNHPCKLMLCENYRSHSAIIQFASDSFYTKKLECGLSQPVHDAFYPLTFFSARGEDVQERDSTSYFNMAEVFEVTDKVRELISSWPEKWGDYRHENAIGVLTPYADQVARIRSRLRKQGLYSVSVERVFNVQGKQFRAVFLSTVRTHKPWVRILPEAVGNEVDLGFFSNPKLLNTALTRAQSLVAVVGDPVSLCSVGKCRRLWEDFIQICQENKSLYGMSYTQLKQNILGVEMRLTWGLNPLANEFEPQMRAMNGYAQSQVNAIPANNILSKALHVHLQTNTNTEQNYTSTAVLQSNQIGNNTIQHPSLMPAQPSTQQPAHHIQQPPVLPNNQTGIIQVPPQPASAVTNPNFPLHPSPNHMPFNSMFNVSPISHQQALLIQNPLAAAGFNGQRPFIPMAIPPTPPVYYGPGPHPLVNNHFGGGHFAVPLPVSIPAAVAYPNAPFYHPHRNTSPNPVAAVLHPSGFPPLPVQQNALVNGGALPITTIPNSIRSRDPSNYYRFPYKGVNPTVTSSTPSTSSSPSSTVAQVHQQPIQHVNTSVNGRYVAGAPLYRRQGNSSGNISNSSMTNSVHLQQVTTTCQVTSTSQMGQTSVMAQPQYPSTAYSGSTTQSATQVSPYQVSHSYPHQQSSSSQAPTYQSTPYSNSQHFVSQKAQGQPVLTPSVNGGVPSNGGGGDIPSFSPDELLVMKRVLEMYSGTSAVEEDGVTGVQNLQSKLSQAVSENGQCVTSYITNHGPGLNHTTASSSAVSAQNYPASSVTTPYNQGLYYDQTPMNAVVKPSHVSHVNVQPQNSLQQSSVLQSLQSNNNLLNQARIQAHQQNIFASSNEIQLQQQQYEYYNRQTQPQQPLDPWASSPSFEYSNDTSTSILNEMSSSNLSNNFGVANNGHAAYVPNNNQSYGQGFGSIIVNNSTNYGMVRNSGGSAYSQTQALQRIPENSSGLMTGARNPAFNNNTSIKTGDDNNIVYESNYAGRSYACVVKQAGAAAAVGAVIPGTSTKVKTHQPQEFTAEQIRSFHMQMTQGIKLSKGGVASTSGTSTPKKSKKK